MKRSYFQKLYSKDEQTKEEKEEEDRIKKTIFEASEKGNDSDMNRKITVEEVDASIKRSKNGAPGPNEITILMLKNSVDILKPLLTDVMNASKRVMRYIQHLGN